MGNWRENQVCLSGRKDMEMIIEWFFNQTDTNFLVSQPSEKSLVSQPLEKSC